MSRLRTKHRIRRALAWLFEVATPLELPPLSVKKRLFYAYLALGVYGVLYWTSGAGLHD